MRRLVALDLPGSDGFVDELRRAWDDGDAVLPIDARLPPPARDALLTSQRPAVIVHANGSREERRDGVPVLDGDALVVATSGTTGDPKGVVLTHAAVRASAEATSARLRIDPVSDSWLCCLPVAHIGGLSVITRALASGTRLRVIPAFDPEAVARAAADGATLVSLVPAALDRLEHRGRGAVGAWRVILLGGSAMPPALPTNAVRTYGMTETGSGVVYDGRPLAGVELAIEDGQVLLRGPMLLRAYRTPAPGLDELTPDGIDPRTTEGWFATGDAGRVLDDGTLHVAGRIGDVIVTGGEKVWPEPVERVLAAAAGVADVAIGSRPDERWGVRVVAFVVPTDPAAMPTLGALRAAVKAVLPAYAAPQELVVVDRIPRTAIGKVRRADLNMGQSELR